LTVNEIGFSHSFDTVPEAIAVAVWDVFEADG
jgi:hypothetical protein